jgi:Rifampin ADP-ribosyl transferase
MKDKHDPRNRRYYHGGDAGLPVGGYIQPPDVTGKDNMIGLNPLRKTDCVYVTKDIAGAMFFASGADNPTVYEVKPEGAIEDDPDHKIKGISFACPKAKIVAIHNVPPEVVRQNRLQMIAARPLSKP